MKAGLVQYDPEWENPEKNILKIEKLTGQLNEKPDLLIFPEMTLTGFTMSSVKFAEDLDGISTLFFMDLSRRMKLNIFAGIIEKSEEGIFNSLVHFDTDGLIAARYRKIHPFTYAGESDNYRAGKEIVISKIGTRRIGLTVCYDLRFPELYRLYGKERVDMIVNISNWPVARIDHWRTLLKARAIENQCFIAGVNRVGSDPGLKYNGYSSVYDPLGKELLSAGEDEKISVVDLDFEIVRETREKLPFLEDMRLV